MGHICNTDEPMFTGETLTLSAQIHVVFGKKDGQTSMHSSRMHTARLLPVSPSMHCGSWVSALGGGSAPGGVSARGVYPSM